MNEKGIMQLGSKIFISDRDFSRIFSDLSATAIEVLKEKKILNLRRAQIYVEISEKKLDGYFQSRKNDTKNLGPNLKG